MVNFVPFLSEDSDLWSYPPRTRPRRRKRVRKPTLASAIAQARKAGLAISSATIAANGSVALNFGERDQTDSNPWDEVLSNVTH